MRKIVNIQDYDGIEENVKEPKIKAHGLLANDKWVELIDKAAAGDLDAIAELAESYYNGTYGQKNLAKAEKWCFYAARKGNARAIALMEKIHG